MKLGHIKPRSNLNDKTVPTQSTNHNSRIQTTKEVSEWVLQLNSSTNCSQKTKAIKEIISLCYSNWANQFYLCNNLKIPFKDGPIAITAVPQSFKSRFNQVFSLFKYLKKVRQSYICWVIYSDTQLGILNLKLITQFQLIELESLFQIGETMIGIFIGKQYFSKARTISTKSNCDKFQSSFGLTTKTTKDSLHDKHNKSNKSLKSISMKEKKTLKHDGSQKLLGQSFNYHHKRLDASQSNLKKENGNKSNSSINGKSYKKLNTNQKKKSTQGLFKIG